MIAYPPQKRPSIAEQFAAWLELMKSTPDRTREHVESHLSCPHCGEVLVIRWGRASDAWMVYHSITAWCDLRGAAWYGATRAEAIAAFQSSGEMDRRRDERRNDSAVAAQTAREIPPSSGHPPGAATLQGWEFSAEGLSTEVVNALLQINSASPFPMPPKICV